jgi:hypothetical protein
MSSTYSTNLRTELIGSGDQAGTWGTTTNTTLGTILEQAIAGVSGGPYVGGTYPTVNFPTDADITLTANNGSVDQSRSAVLVVTSTGSLTATRNIIAPASASKVYIIKNSTTGGQTIQIKYSSGTGVQIANGFTKIVYGNGTNFYEGITEASNFAVDGIFSAVGAANFGSTVAVTGAQTNSSTLQATTITATSQFSGPGTGLTGTATSLNIGGNAATATTATNVTNPFPSGTRLVFAQAAAPTGWTQDTSDTANNRMIRVVASSGGGLGGAYDPTIMNVVPAHSHTYSGGTSTENTGHVHNFSTTTGYMNSNNTHSHNGTTGYMDSNNVHNHGVSDPGHNHNLAMYTGGSGYAGISAPDGGPVNLSPYFVQGATTGISINNTDINHTHYFNTSTVDINHTHYLSGTTADISNNHNHTYSGTTNNGSSATDWTPRYNNVIICQKN